MEVGIIKNTINTMGIISITSILNHVGTMVVVDIKAGLDMVVLTIQDITGFNIIGLILIIILIGNTIGMILITTMIISIITDPITTEKIKILGADLRIDFKNFRRAS